MLITTGILIGGISAYAGLRAKKALSKKPSLGKRVRTKEIQIKEQENLPSIPPEPVSTVKRDFAIASGSLGLVVTGYLFLPALATVGIAGLVYLTVPTWKHAYHDLVKRKRFTRMVLEATVLPINLLFGHYVAVAGAYWILYFAVRTMEKAKGNTVKNLADVFVAPSQQIVYVLRDGAEVEMTIEDIVIGDILAVGAGEIIPVDGEVITGHATVDQHMLTGESQPVEKQQGDEVFAATLLLSGNIQIKVDKAGADTIANQTHQVLSQMTSFTDDLELRSTDNADRVALPYFLTGTITGILKSPNAGLALLWAPLDDALYAAGPLSVLNYLNIGLRRGVLIKDGRALETLRKVTTVVFDKTGTLTDEIPSVVNVHTCKDLSETEVLRYAAAAEQKQIHPVALAILEAAEQQDIDLPSVKGQSYKTGYGISVTLDERTIQVGSYRFMQQLSLTLPDSLQIIEEQSHEYGYSLIYIAVDNEIIGAVELHATIRPDALETINKLHEMNYQVCIISGDHERPTHHLAKQLGIDRYFAETLPQDKANLIKAMQDEGEVICYMGDGINDTIALKQAEVSVSLSGASTIATDTAQIILMNEKLNNIIDLIELSKQLSVTHRNTLVSGVVPTVGIIGGVFFFHMGVSAAILAYLSGIGLSMGYAMLPLLKERARNKKITKQLMSPEK